MTYAHGTTLIKATYDSEVDASYFQFCECMPRHTVDLSGATIHEVLVDYVKDENGEHICGVELLNPNAEAPLQDSLKKIKGITDNHISLILNAIRTDNLIRY